jgi:hypothetical protein
MFELIDLFFLHTFQANRRYGIGSEITATKSRLLIFDILKNSQGRVINITNVFPNVVYDFPKISFCNKICFCLAQSTQIWMKFTPAKIEALIVPQTRGLHSKTKIS